MTHPETFESLLDEAMSLSLHLHGFYQRLDSRPNSEKVFGHELIREWNVRFQCPNGHYASGTGDTPNAALKSGLAEAKRIAAWQPTLAVTIVREKRSATLEDLELL